MSVKLVSINIEGRMHLDDKILPFLSEQKPDVIFLQEIFEVDVEEVKRETKMEGLFTPMAHMQEEGFSVPEDNNIMGILILTKRPILELDSHTYHKDQKSVGTPVFVSSADMTKMNRAINWVKIEDEGQEMTLATTHFTWSKKGAISQFQRDTYKSLEEVLDRLPIAVIAGDFNTPREGEIFSKLSQRYKDNIPPDLKTTIDNKIHKASEDIFLVVDGLFSAPGYEVQDIQVIDGISDHMALVGTVRKVS